MAHSKSCITFYLSLFLCISGKAIMLFFFSPMYGPSIDFPPFLFTLRKVYFLLLSEDPFKVFCVIKVKAAKLSLRLIIVEKYRICGWKKKTIMRRQNTTVHFLYLFSVAIHPKEKRIWQPQLCKSTKILWLWYSLKKCECRNSHLGSTPFFPRNSCVNDFLQEVSVKSSIKL